MPRSLPLKPRKIFPPPTTTTTCTPSSRTSRICSAMCCTASGQMPTPFSPPSASPLSLSRMRENFGFLAVVIKLEARAASAKFLTAGAPNRQIKAADQHKMDLRNKKGVLADAFEILRNFQLALSPTWNRTKRRMVISSPSCLAICATCSLTLTSELRFTKPWSTRQ